MKKRLGILLLVLVLILSACGQQESRNTGNKDDDKIKIVASFFPAADLASKIGGEKVTVKNLTQSGSAHGFEPSVGDMKEIVQADLLIINGAGFETWVDKVKAANPNLDIIEISKGIELIPAELGHVHEDEETSEHGEEDQHDEEGHGLYDPHTWLSIKNLDKMAQNIYNKLSDIDADNEEYYNNNFESVKIRVDEIMDKYVSKINKYKGKSIVVPHEGFAYLVNELGIEQIGLEGINSDSEPTLTKIAEISEIMKEKEIETVFYDFGKSDKAAQTIANEIKGKVKPISTLEVITDEDVKAGKDLFTLIEMNLQNILDSFEGK